MNLINTYGAFVSFIVIGYCLARFAQVSPSSPFTLIRYLFLPAIIYSSVSRGISPKLLTLIMLSGAGVAFVGEFALEKLGSYLKMNSSSGRGAPNVAYFTLPLLGLCYGSKGMATACYFMMGIYLAQELRQGSRTDFKKYLKEPFLIAFIAALIVSYISYRNPPLKKYFQKILLPLASSSYFMIAIYLGTTFHPANRIDKDSFMPVCLKLITGLAVAIAAINVFGFKGLIAKTIVLCALAAPGSSLGGNDSNNVNPIGVLVSTVAVALLYIYKWTPWTFRIF